MPTGTATLPRTIARIHYDIEGWYKINVGHFRTQKISTRYIADRVGETLYQEKKKGNITNYRLLPNDKSIEYWMNMKDGYRYHFTLFLVHKIDNKKSLIDAYNRAMKGI